MFVTFRRWLSHLQPRHWIWVALIAAAVIAAKVWRLEAQQVHAWARGLSGPGVFALLTLLPLVGVPSTLLHVTAGMRYGLALGFGLVALSILIQLITSYAIVKAMPEFFTRRLESIRHRLPQAAHRSLALFTLLMPGAPYAMQLYALPLAGVPFRIYLGYSLPVHVIRSLVGISLGRFSDDLTPMRIAALATYTVILIAAWAWSFRRLRERLSAGQPPVANDPRPGV